MKNLKVFRFAVFLFVFVISISNVNAQFLKKLSKRVEQKVENAVIEKTANKAAEKATNSMDKMFDVNPFGGGGQEKADASLVADNYEFSWKYSLKMSNKEGDLFFDYYLQPDAPYFGFTSEILQNMFTVMDNEHKVTVIFMRSDDDNSNMGMVTQLPSDLDLEETKDEYGKFTFEKLPPKTINGYQCKGVRATSENYDMIMYFTDEAKVSFDDIYKNSNAKIPSQLLDYFNTDDKILMMSMDFTDLKNKKRSGTMECIGLEKVGKTIKKSEYKFM